VSGRIIALEPNLKNSLLLERNIIRNKITNATPLNLAAGRQTCEEKLYLSNDNQGDHRLYRGEGGRVCEIVNCTTIDALVESQNSVPNIVKIDTQGFDYYVLLGMQNLLSQSKHLTVFTEFWEYGNRLSGVRSEDYYQLLATHFKTVEFIDEAKQRTHPVDLGFILKECQKVDGFMHANLLCSK
jgi:FkbM family methyltransferase